MNETNSKAALEFAKQCLAGKFESEEQHENRMREQRLQVKKDNKEAHRKGNFKGVPRLEGVPIVDSSQPLNAPYHTALSVANWSFKKENQT